MLKRMTSHHYSPLLPPSFPAAILRLFHYLSLPPSPPPTVHTVWSLSSVKVALSHLQWQREKVLRSDTPLHLKIGATLMEVVGAAFHLKPDQLFNRPRMVKALLSQQKRGAVSGEMAYRHTLMQVCTHALLTHCTCIYAHFFEPHLYVADKDYP